MRCILTYRNAFFHFHVRFMHSEEKNPHLPDKRNRKLDFSTSSNERYLPK